MGFYEDIISKKLEDTSTEQEVGIGGFTAFARISETTEFSSRVPTSYLEDGSNASDHIVNDPIILNISGNVGDIFVRKSNVEETINATNSLIGETAIYLPVRTQSQIQKTNGLISSFRDRIRQVDRAIDTGNKLLTLGRSSAKTNQELFLETMVKIRDARIPINIDMANKQYKLMVITSLVITKDAQSNAGSFKITAQQIRLAQTLYTQVKRTPSSTIEKQVGGLTDKGSQTGKEPEQSLLNYIGGLL